MRRWSRSEAVITALLAAALTGTSWAEDAATSADPALPAVQTPLDVLRQQSAQQRWEQLKSRHAAQAAAPLTEVDAEPVEPAADAAAPYPDGQDEPAWIVPAASPQPAAAAPSPTVERPAVEPVQARSSEPRTAMRMIRQEPAAPGTIPLQKLRLRTIDQISPFYDRNLDQDIRDYAVARAQEYGIRIGESQFEPRAFADTAMVWEAPNFYHYPLYFEDATLERYGHTHHFLVQPFVSGGKFMGQLVALPYQMTLDPVWKPMYSLGWYRPGEVAPKLHYQIPWNWQAAAVEAGVITGLFFLIP